MKKGKIHENVNIYETIPEGWGKLKGAVTAPKGYVWIWNRKSRFNGQYQRGLLKLDE